MPPSPRVTNAATHQSRRLRDIALFAGLVLLVLIGLAVLAVATGWEETLSALGAITWAEFSILLLLSLVNYLFRSVRWHLFATRLGIGNPFLANVRHYLGGFAMTVTPGRIGELVRMRWLRRETGWSFEKTAPLVLVDRSADLAAMAILLAVGIAISSTGLNGGVPVVVLALAAAYVATRPRLLSAFGDAGHHISRKRFPRLFVKVRRAAKSLNAFSGPSILLAAGALGVIGWFAEGYAFFLLLQWMGADVGLGRAMAIFIFATLAGGLTGAPGGLGGAEAAMIALLVFEGTPTEIAVPATLIIRVTTLWFAIGIGLLVFPLAERLSLKATS